MPACLKQSKQVTEQAVSDVQRAQNQTGRLFFNVLGKWIAFLLSDINQRVKRHTLLFGAFNNDNTGESFNEIAAFTWYTFGKKIKQ